MSVNGVKHDRHRAVNKSKSKQPFVMGNVENPLLFVTPLGYFPHKRHFTRFPHTLDVGARGFLPRCRTHCHRGKTRGPAAELWAMLHRT